MNDMPMTNETKFNRKVSLTLFSSVTVTNAIGMYASWGSPSMYATALMALLHTLAFLIFCIWLKKYSSYQRIVLIMVAMLMFPLVLWFTPVPMQVILYIFLTPCFYAISMRRKRNLILPLLNGVVIAVILYLKVHNILYAAIFFVIYTFCTLITAIFAITLYTNFIELERAYDIITDIARKDRLTGIYNRFGLEDAVKERQQEPCYAIMMDIDYFKQVNDRYGHEAGDDVLCMLGTLLQKLSAKDFVVSRRGGEEFLLYSFKNYEETMKIVRQFYAEVDRQVIVQGEHIHVSTGISSQGCISEALIADADKKLYYSKETGRNRITTVLP